MEVLKRMTTQLELRASLLLKMFSFRAIWIRNYSIEGVYTFFGFRLLVVCFIKLKSIHARVVNNENVYIIMNIQFLAENITYIFTYVKYLSGTVACQVCKINLRLAKHVTVAYYCTCICTVTENQ